MRAETYMVDAELDKDNQIVVDDVVFAVRPAAHAGTTARLVRVLSTAVKLVFAVLNGVDVVVGELGPLVVEAVGVREDFLERWRVDLVSDRFAVDWVPDAGVLDLEGSVGV